MNDDRPVIISCSCPVCGDLTLNRGAVTLYVWTGKARNHLNHYTFTCPTCRDLISKPALGDVIALLTTAEVRIVKTVVPDEVDDPAHDGAPLTSDWVLDAIASMAGPAWQPDKREFA